MKSSALVLGGAGGILWQLPNWISTYRDTLQVRVRLTAPEGEKYTIRAKHAWRLELLSEGIGRWVLRLPHTRGTAEFRADAGLRAAAMVLPHYNRYGASENQVQNAVKELGATISADKFFAQAATRLHRGAPFYERNSKVTQHLMLGLEMISHEEQERRALEGELHELEAMWREAEEVAAISDNLLLPSAIAERFRGKTTE